LFFATSHSACTIPGKYASNVRRMLMTNCADRPTWRNAATGGRKMASQDLDERHRSLLVGPLTSVRRVS
jgi:hypothetical protein